MRHVLVDFDGVLFCNRAASASVVRRCEQFVARRTGTGVEEARAVNRVLFPVTGHSSMIPHLLGCRPTTIAEFDYSVYTDALMQEVLSNLELEDRVRMQAFREWASELRAGGCAVSVYSDAPLMWTLGVSAALGGLPEGVRAWSSARHVGYPKSHPASPWTASTAILGGSSADCVLIDDSPAVLRNFLEFGWTVMPYHEDSASLPGTPRVMPPPPELL